MNVNNLELYMELINLERLLRAENARAARLYGPLSDVSHGQGRILAYLKLNEPVSVKDLAAALDIRPQSLQDHLRHMEEDGLIKRNRSEVDSRVKLVSLTPKAREFNQDLRSYEDIFKGIPEEDTVIFRECLEIIKKNLSDELGESRFEPIGPGAPPPRPDHPEKGLLPPHLRDRDIPPRPPLREGEEPRPHHRPGERPEPRLRHGRAHHPEELRPMGPKDRPPLFEREEHPGRIPEDFRPSPMVMEDFERRLDEFELNFAALLDRLDEFLPEDTKVKDGVSPSLDNKAITGETQGLPEEGEKEESSQTVVE